MREVRVALYDYCTAMKAEPITHCLSHLPALYVFVSLSVTSRKVLFQT